MSAQAGESKPAQPEEQRDESKSKNVAAEKAGGNTEVEANGDVAKASGDTLVNKGDNPSTENGDKEEAKPDKSELRNRNWREKAEEDNRRDREDGRNSRGGRGRGRGGAHHDRKSNARKNYTVKTAYEELPESDDPEEIRKQVEFYFSDSNLPTDKFLLTQVGGPKNQPVPIKTIHNFKRMRHFQPYSAVVAALKESDFLNITENDEIVRKTPLPDDTSMDIEANVQVFEDRARSRSIYAKGFGEEGPNTQFEIESYFEPYGPINAIRLRRVVPEKDFKGSVFVEFDTEETQKAFLDLENKPKFNGKDLKIMSKEEYVLGKAEDIKAGKVRASESGRGRGGGRGRGRGRGGRGGGRDRRDRDNRRRDLDDEDPRDTRDRRRRGEDGDKDVASEKPQNKVEVSDEKDNKKRSAPEGDADSTAKESKKAKTEGDNGT